MVSSKTEFFNSFAQEIKLNLKENFNISEAKDWKKGQSNFVTVYKFVKLNLDYKETQSNVLKIYIGD